MSSQGLSDESTKREEERIERAMANRSKRATIGPAAGIAKKFSSEFMNKRDEPPKQPTTPPRPTTTTRQAIPPQKTPTPISPKQPSSEPLVETPALVKASEFVSNDRPALSKGRSYTNLREPRKSEEEVFREKSITEWMGKLQQIKKKQEEKQPVFVPPQQQPQVNHDYLLKQRSASVSDFGVFNRSPTPALPPPAQKSAWQPNRQTQEEKEKRRSVLASDSFRELYKEMMKASKDTDADPKEKEEERLRQERLRVQKERDREEERKRAEQRQAAEQKEKQRQEAEKQQNATRLLQEHVKQMKMKEEQKQPSVEQNQEIISFEVPHRSILFEYPASSHSTVCVAGSFNGWKPYKLEAKGDVFCSSMHLMPGSYEFKFIVDGSWVCDPNRPTSTDSTGNANNLLVVE